MGHIYSPHYISVKISQNIRFFLSALLLFIDTYEGRIYTCQYHTGSTVGCGNAPADCKMEQLCRKSEWPCKCPRRHVQEAREAGQWTRAYC
jgi:hypothetical protein